MTHLLCWSDSDFRAQPVSPDYCRTLLAHMQLLVPRFSSARSKKTSARGQHIWTPPSSRSCWRIHNHNLMVARQNTAFTCVLSLAGITFLKSVHSFSEIFHSLPAVHASAADASTKQPSRRHRKHDEARWLLRRSGRLGGRRCTGGLGRGGRLARCRKDRTPPHRARPERSGRACRARRSPGHARTWGTPALSHRLPRRIPGTFCSTPSSPA